MLHLNFWFNFLNLGTFSLPFHIFYYSYLLQSWVNIYIQHMNKDAVLLTLKNSIKMNHFLLES